VEHFVTVFGEDGHDEHATVRFLSRAHIEHALAGDVTVAGKAADVDARLDAKQADLDDIKSRIAQLDQTRTVATKGHTKTTTVGGQGPARERLTQQRDAAETTITNLRIEKAKVDGERKAVEADLGPVRYLATLLGATDETTMRWFILVVAMVVALLLDPAAVLLLLAATHRGAPMTSIAPGMPHSTMRCASSGR
jgi:hypothetical protein